MIVHKPILNTAKIIEHYSEKDGVPVKYVCTTALNDGTKAIDIFYRETPHPKFGNRYFAIFENDGLFITNADTVETLEFGMVEDDEGNLRYSQHRWDYQSFNNGNMIDGGRAYIKTSANGALKIYKVKDGEMVEHVN